MNRRRYLCTLGSVLSIGGAGCLGLGSNDTTVAGKTFEVVRRGCGTKHMVGDIEFNQQKNIAKIDGVVSNQTSYKNLNLGVYMSSSPEKVMLDVEANFDTAQTCENRRSNIVYQGEIRFKGPIPSAIYLSHSTPNNTRSVTFIKPKD